jgi:uncharacterized membrane protein YhaH (DUF805 family)
MKEVLSSIGRGFAGLLRFGGRAGRARFWHYAGFVLVLTQFAGMAAFLPVFFRIRRYALAHPEQARISSGPGYYSIAINGNAPDMNPIVADILDAVTILPAVTIAVLAAAVVRRLHDRDRRGYWGLLPLPFLAAALVLMPKLMAGVAAEPDAPDLSLSFAVFVNNLLYLGMLALLVVLLAGKGTPGPNRFGPPPD